MSNERIETNGIEPEDLACNEFIWTYWKDGDMCLGEAYGYFEWESTTHWMPADIHYPQKPL